MDGYVTKYLFYDANRQSMVTIPRPIILANNLDWNHKDDINLVVKTIDGKKGLFLFKKEEE
jgi:hypothetical protein